LFVTFLGGEKSGGKACLERSRREPPRWFRNLENWAHRPCRPTTASLEWDRLPHFVRDRDTMEQERVAVDELEDHLKEKLGNE